MAINTELLTKTLLESEVDYGLRGQLNIRLKKLATETHKGLARRTKQFAQDLAEITGIKAENFHVQKSRLIVDNPEVNARLLAEALNLDKGALAFDKSSGVPMVDKGAARVARTIAEKTGAPIDRAIEDNVGKNTPGKWTKKIALEGFTDKPQGSGRGA